MPIIKEIEPLESINDERTYLLLISPERIPHLGVVSQGKYYSLTHKKSIVGEVFQPYFNFLKRSDRKMIFIELKNCSLTPADTFGRFEKAKENGDTCLYPVRDFVLSESSASFVYELIPELYLHGKIEASFHVNMEDDIEIDKDFKLSIYSKEAIFSYIESLNEKYAKRT